MKAAILFSVIISAFALDCPVYQCTDLGQGVCAQQQEGSILLNQNGCGDGQACDISQVYDPTGTLPAQSVQCLNQSEINTNPLKNFTEFLENIIANETAISAEPVAPLLNATANTTSISAEPAAVNATGAEGAVPVNVTANVTTTEVTTGNATAGGIRRLQGNDTAEYVNVTTPEGETNATAIAESAIAIAENVTGAIAESVTAIVENATAIVENVTQPESGFAQTFLPFIQQTDQGYEVYISGIGIFSIKAIPQITCQTVPNRNLQEGSNPKTCSADADCQLQDGSLATCVCGLDGQSYCQPDYYDDEFSVFTNQCIDGRMNQDVLEDWMIYHQFYVALISDPGCAANLFLQLQNATQIQDQYWY